MYPGTPSPAGQEGTAIDPSRGHAGGPSEHRRSRSQKLSVEERQQIHDIFINEPERTASSIARDLNLPYGRIQELRLKFKQSGNTDARLTTKRLTKKQKSQLMHIFNNTPERSNSSIASDFGVTRSAISSRRRRFEHSSNISPSKLTNYDDRKFQICDVFINEPDRTCADIARQFNVSDSSVRHLKGIFNKSMNPQPGPGAHEAAGPSHGHPALLEPGEIERLRDLSRFMELEETPAADDWSVQASVAFHEMETTLNPDDACAWNNLGRAHEQAGDFEAARQAFEKARQADRG